MGFFSTDPVTYILLTIGIVFIMTVLSLLFKERMGKIEKKLFFMLIVIPVALSTLYLAGHTVYENTISETGGPVHWHLDYQVWVCGERLDLVDPKGLSNKVGTPLIHEHNDDRIHIEGTLIKKSEASLGNFFEKIGGRLTSSNLVYNTEDQGVVDVTSGDTCDGHSSTLKVYLNGERMEEPENYVMAPYALVPPGDCVIIDFSPGNSETTDKMCESWAAKEWNYQNWESKRGVE